MTIDIAERNSAVSIASRSRAGLILWQGILIVLFARSILAVVLHLLLAAWFSAQGHVDPMAAAAPWYIVYGSLIDVCCLVLLWRLTRQEGIGLRDLVGFQRKKLWRDVLFGVALMVLFGGIAFLLSGFVLGPIIYGAELPPLPMSPLPLWAAIYALLVWPLLWSVTEDMVYLGYSLPRLEAWFGKRWLAVLIMSGVFGLQHAALPIIDGQWAVYRFVVPFVLGIGWAVIYLKIRRLAPFFLAHWMGNFMSVLFLVLLPLWAT